MRPGPAPLALALLIPALAASCGGSGGPAKPTDPTWRGKAVSLHAKDLTELRDSVLQRAELDEYAKILAESAPLFAGLFRGEDARLAEQAAAALVAVEEQRPGPVPVPEEILAAVEEALRRKEPGVRASAALALAVLAPPSRPGLGRTLAGLLKDADYRVRREALRAIRALGPSGREWAPEVRALLKGPTGEAFEAAMALSGLGDAAPETVDLLSAAAADTGRASESIRAARALGDLGPAASRAGPALLKALSSRSAGRLSSDLARALGLVGSSDPAAAALLEKLLSDRDPDTRYAAVVALARLGKKEPRLADLAATAAKSAGPLGIEAAEAQVLMGRDAEGGFAALSAPLEGEVRSPELAAAAAAALGRLLAGKQEVPAKAREALEAAARKAPRAVRLAAAKALGRK